MTLEAQLLELRGKTIGEKKIKELLGKDVKDPYSFFKKHKISIRKKKVYFSDSDLKFIKENGAGLSSRAIGLKLNKSSDSVYYHLIKMGLKYRRDEILTEEKKEFIKNNAYKYSIKELSKLTKLNIGYLRKYLNTNNIKYVRLRSGRNPENKPRKNQVDTPFINEGTNPFTVKQKALRRGI